MRYALTVAGVIVVVAATPGTAQEPAPRRLEVPVGKYESDLSAISGARELRDGRVLMSDSRAPLLAIVDLRAGTATPLGGTGSGPNEYLRPGGMYAGRGDTTYVLDRDQARVLLVTGDGRIAGARSIRRQGTSGGSSADVDLQQVDGNALAYFRDPAGVFAALRRGRDAGSDSTALLRFDPARQRADTVARLKDPQRRLTSAQGNVVNSQVMLFDAVDGWGVAPSGRVAIVRAAPPRTGRLAEYRVDWVEPDGRVTSGPPVPYEPVPVTAEDRAAVVNASRGSSLGLGRTGNPSSAAGGATTAPWFADVKPAFAPDGVIVSPDERVWVARHVARQASVYDVFDRRGVRVDRIELPARSRIIGFGPSAIYVSEPDADDIPRLRKYAM